MASSQSEDSLQFLLQYLACPIDPDHPLVAVWDAAGQVVALRAGEREYPVVNNIPCMLPDLSGGFAPGVAPWQKHQDEKWQDYQAGEEGVFSSDNSVTRYAGEIIDQQGDGLFLDVGCGALPLPIYMAASTGHIAWVGIDPFFGDAARHFPFVQAIGESLPFRPAVFDGVLYASTIFHQLDPRRSLEGTRRVLKPQGRLYIWHEPPKDRLRYVVWRVQRALGWPRRYNRLYQWAFTRQSLGSLLRQPGFTLEREVLLCTRCSSYGKCKEPGEFLMVARPEGAF
jgi:SAM-dependent methyltransferase